jgi:predicted LPLAT superfamily acyltransferase
MVMNAAGPDAFSFETVGEERLVAAVAEGRGVVLISAHLGNWELMGARLAEYGLPVTIVMFDGVQPAVKAALSAHAARVGFEVLYTDGGPNAAAAMMAALAQGRVLGMMADRSLAGRSAALPFLGGRAEFPLGPYALAAASGAPLFHVFALRRGRGRYVCQGHEAGMLRYRGRAQRGADLERWAGEFAARLEEATRAAPEQWNNFYPFWIGDR